MSTSAAPAGAPASVPAPWRGLVDDAAVFPPGNAPLSDAVADFRDRRQEPWAALVGPLVVSDRSLVDLAALVEADEADALLPVSVVCSGGAGSLGPAAHWADRADVELSALELALRDLDDLPGSARRVVRAAESVAASGVEVPVHVEVPLPHDGRATRGWLDALDEVAAADLRLKFRTGGPEKGLVPPIDALAAGIEAALDRELAFKCTAGLHHALRHRDDRTGEPQHGFLNVLLATRASLDGDEIAAMLAETDRDAVLDHLDTIGVEALGRTRRWFTSFGCCGVTDPYRDLVDLGLVQVAPCDP